MASKLHAATLAAALMNVPGLTIRGRKEVKLILIKVKSGLQ
jgi:hypothetical protein